MYVHVLERLEKYHPNERVGSDKLQRHITFCTDNEGFDILIILTSLSSSTDDVVLMLR